MNVRHTALIRMRLLDKADLTRVVDEAEVPVRNVEGHKLVTSMMFNALTMSGGVLWRHPATGEQFPAGLTWDVTLVNPTDALSDGALCDCAECVP